MAEAGFVIDKRPAKLTALIDELDDDDDAAVDADENDEVSAAERYTGALRERPAVWKDDDDSTVTVNIATQSRLRKLRSAETETVVSGAEYEAKLRQQFNKLKSNQRWTTALQAAAQHTTDEGMWSGADVCWRSCVANGGVRLQSAAWALVPAASTTSSPKALSFRWHAAFRSSQCSVDCFFPKLNSCRLHFPPKVPVVSFTAVIDSCSKIILYMFANWTLVHKAVYTDLLDGK